MNVDEIKAYLHDGGCCEKRIGPLAFDRPADIIDPAFAQAIVRVFRRQMRRVLEDLDQSKLPLKSIRKGNEETVDLIMPASEFVIWAAELEEAVTPHIERVVRFGGTEALAELEPVITGISFDLENKRVLDFIANEARIIGRKSTDQFRKEIREELLAGISEGESAAQIGKRISDRVDKFAPWKGEQIARTESTYSYMEGTISGWEQSGAVTGKIYVLSPDPCPICISVAERYGDGRQGDPVDTSLARRTVNIPDESHVFGLREPMFKPGESLAIITGEGDDQKTKLISFNYEGIAETGVQGPPIHPNCRCQMRPVIDERFGL